MAGKKRSGYDQAVTGFRRALSVLIYILLIVFFIFIGRTAYVYGYDVFNEQSAESAPGRDVTVTIPEHASVDEISAILKDKGVIRNKSLFKVQERLSAYHGKMKGGTYKVNTSQKPTEIMAILSGDSTVSSAGGESSAENASSGPAVSADSAG